MSSPFIKNDYVASVFVHVLRFLGVYSVAISYRAAKRHLDLGRNAVELLHIIANNMLLNNIKICMEDVYGTPIGFYKGVTLLYDTKRHTESKFYIVDARDMCSKDITEDVISLFLKTYPRDPVILVDAILWELHHEEEKRRAVKQFMVLLSTIRKRLTDLNVVLVSPPKELIDCIKEFKNSIGISNGSIYNIDLSKSILLDPYAPEELTMEDIMNSHYFIIGFLIDDRFPRPYATYMLKLLRNLDLKRRSIKLHGSLIGVPREINKIIDIILDVRLYGLSLEKAVVNNMGIDDKIKRIVYDIKKHLVKEGTVDEQYIKTLATLYNIDEHRFKKVYMRVRKLLNTTTG